MTNFGALLEPFTIGNVTLPNRLVMLPMGTELCGEDGRSTPAEAAYYAARARGGTGLVMTGITFVSSEFDPIPPGLARIDTDAHTEGIKAIADAVHAEGGLLALQLTMGLGRNNQYCETLGMEPRSSAEVPWFFDPSVTCRPLAVDEIAKIVAASGEAARRAHEAGVDVIDIHGHTGYLVDQFMSACWNTRTDQYGGSPQNRARFLTEVLAAVKANAPGRPVSVRLSINHRFPGGRTVEETRALLPFMETAGVDLLLCDDGSYEAMDYVFPPYYLGDECMTNAVDGVKEYTTMPVVACGNITPTSGNRLLEEGRTDLVGIGRGLIADPDIIVKIVAGQEERIRPCIRCNQLCVGNAFMGKALGCAVNPAVSHELDGPIATADALKRIAIIGAGPAGLEAARVAGLRGHTVDVYEKSNRLGGVLHPAATPDFKRQLRQMISWWEGELALLPTVHVHFETEISQGAPQLAGVDEIIVAVGSTPLSPPIPGLDSDNVIEVIDAHENPAKVGHSVVVCGGGLSGADLALELAQAGRAVTLVEMADAIAKDMLPLNKISLDARLSSANVTILTGTTVTAVTGEGVLVSGPDGEHTLTCDTVVTAFGVAPATHLVAQLSESTTPVRAVGDCVEPRKVGDAINDAYNLAAAL